MKYLPIFYDLSVRPCLVVGPGEIAARKVRQLRKAEASVTVIAPEICEELQSLANNKEIEYIAERFSEEMLKDKILVIAATNDEKVNRQVSELAKAINIPVNVVDMPE